jgi:hypothetical protein
VGAGSRVPRQRDSGRHRALSIGILELPDEIGSVPAYGHCVTDQASATLEVFLAGKPSKRINDYQGCFWAPFALHDFEVQLDSISGVSHRWRAR